MEFWAIFLAGLLGGAHCLGMCGGIVTMMICGKFSYVWLYNLGRILAYIAVGTALGALGEIGFLFVDSFALRLFFYAFALFLMLGMGIYFLGIPYFVAPFEKLGGIVWQKIFPKTQKFLPIQKKSHALFLGILWGLMPCGLLYSAFATALASGSVLKSAGLMMSFSLGTLPNLLFAPFLFQKIGNKSRQYLQKTAGVFLIFFAFSGCYNLLEFSKFF